jgi:hypothetical protein
VSTRTVCCIKAAESEYKSMQPRHWCGEVSVTLYDARVSGYKHAWRGIRVPCEIDIEVLRNVCGQMFPKLNNRY